MTELTYENCRYSFRSFDLVLFVNSSLMILEIHFLDEAVPADIALVVAVLISFIFCCLHIYPFIVMVLPNVLVQSAYTVIRTAAETAAVPACCGLVLALGLGTFGPLVHLCSGWLSGTPYIFAVRIQYW